jgi:hypothetical protein
MTSTRPAGTLNHADEVWISWALVGIEIDDILKDFSPHRAVAAYETDIYRQNLIVGNIRLAYIFVSSLMAELPFK